MFLVFPDQPSGSQTLNGCKDCCTGSYNTHLMCGTEFTSQEFSGVSDCDFSPEALALESECHERGEPRVP